MPAAVGVIVLYDRRFLLDDVCPGAAAGHRRAEEYVDY